MSINHFQKTYAPILAGLLSDMQLPTGTVELTERIFNMFDRCYYDIQDEKSIELLSRKLAEAFNMDADGFLDAIIIAKGLTETSIKDAPYRIASDFGEASEIVIDFVEDESQSQIMFGVDTGGAAKAYAFVKLPYNERIDFLYGSEFASYQMPLYPQNDMKYLGFYSRATCEAYALKEPLDGLYWFGRKDHPFSEYEGELKRSLIKAIQREVASRITKKMPKPQDIPAPDQKAVEWAMSSYGKGKSSLEFEDMVEYSEYRISAMSIVRFIDDRDTLIAEKAEEYINENGPELERLWIAHHAVRKIFDQITAVGSNLNNNGG